MAATAFTFLFAIACLGTFALGARKQWLHARITTAVVAIVAFFLALMTAKVR